MNIPAIKILHQNAFCWNNKGYIPLSIRVENMRDYDGIHYGTADFLPKLFEKQMENINRSINLGSDFIPVIPILNYGTGIAASLLGADISLANSNYPDALALGFNVKPILHSLDSLNILQTNRDNIFYENLIAHYKYYTEHVPEGIAVCGSPEDPFDVAYYLRGNDLFYDLTDDPEGVHELLDLCTRLVIQTETELRTLAGHCVDGIMQPAPSAEGLWFDGFRIAGDTLIMLSEDMIKEFVVPCYKKMAQAFGCKLYVHFCSVDPSAGKQVLNAFLDCEEVAGLSTQFGLELMESRYEDVKDKLMFDTCYDGAHGKYIEKFGGEKQFAEYIKRKFGEKSGLIINLRVSSEEEGKRLVDIWREVFMG